MDPNIIRKAPGEFRVLEYDVPEFTGDYAGMDYGDPRAERLVELKQEFDLDGVIAGQETEWDEILALKRWVRSRWNHGWSYAFTEVKDALDILREAAKGEQFTCGFYARVFSECATALGWPTRQVGVGLDRCEFPRDHTYWNVGHAVVEIWSNELAKWVLMDPDLNVHYECCGVPLGALEIHDAWLTDQGAFVDMVQDEPEFVMPTGRTIEIGKEVPMPRESTEEGVRLKMERFARNRVLDYYARVRIGNWNLIDDRCLPSFLVHFNPSGPVNGTRDIERMNWTVNLARASFTPSWDETSALVQTKLEHCMPYFSHYEVQVDEADWQPLTGDEFPWAMREGVNALQFRAVNICDRRGPTSGIVVGYAKAAW
jgi:hypothetical protein